MLGFLRGLTAVLQIADIRELSNRCSTRLTNVRSSIYGQWQEGMSLNTPS